MGTRLSDLLAGLAAVNQDARRRPLREIASLVHLSPSRAQRVFTRLVGESPGRYQHRVALDRAAATLASSKRPIADVAYATGFGSHEGFTRAFHAKFGLSPLEYRNRAAATWTADNVAHAEKTSPCIGLYRKPLIDPRSIKPLFIKPLSTKPLSIKPHATDQERRMEEPTQSVTVEELTPTPVLYMARRIDRDEFAQVLAELLPAVFQHVMAQGLAMAGPPYVRYMEQSAAFLSVQAGIPLAEVPKPPASDTNIEVGELPGGSAAVTIHRGPYDTLGDSYMVLDRWMAANGRQAAGAPWEVYLTDPGEVPDPNDWETQILWPVG